MTVSGIVLSDVESMLAGHGLLFFFIHSLLFEHVCVCVCFIAEQRGERRVTESMTDLVSPAAYQTHDKWKVLWP